MFKKTKYPKKVYRCFQSLEWINSPHTSANLSKIGASRLKNRITPSLPHLLTTDINRRKIKTKIGRTISVNPILMENNCGNGRIGK